MPTTNLPQYGTCRKCGCSILRKGKTGWYHSGERTTGTPAPGHYAEPAARAVA